MSYKKGFTKSLAKTIPALVKIQELNSDVGLYAGEIKINTSYVDYDLKAIFVSFYKASKIKIISTVLHELGHYRIGYRSRNIIQNEINAWVYARQYAEEHNLPFSDKVAEDAIFSYMKVYARSKVCYDVIRKSKKKIKESTYQRFFETVWVKKYCLRA